MSADRFRLRLKENAVNALAAGATQGQVIADVLAATTHPGPTTTRDHALARDVVETYELDQS